MSSGRWRGPGWRLFDAVPARSKTARGWIGYIVSTYAGAVDPDDAALVVSELFGNAVMHGPRGGRVLVGYVLWRDGARVVVCDGGGASLPRLGEGTGLAEGGRGLRVVDALGARWGSFRTGQGQVVWCDLGQPMYAEPGEAWAWLDAVLTESPLAPSPGEPVMAASGAPARSAPGPLLRSRPRRDAEWGSGVVTPHLSLAVVQPEERRRRLEALAAELAEQRWTAHLTQPPNGIERLFVQHPSATGRRGYVLAAPDDQTGHWCYWLAVTERCIAPADEPAAAAAAIIHHLAAEQTGGTK